MALGRSEHSCTFPAAGGRPLLLSKIVLSGLATALLALSPAEVWAETRDNRGEQRAAVSWQQIAPGYQIGSYALQEVETGLTGDVLLVRLSPKAMNFTLGLGSDVSAGRSDAKALTIVRKGAVGINANFFDTDGAPIGVVIRNGTLLNKLHRGGKLLTDVFFIKDNRADIVSRDDFDTADVSLAVQSGPRLIRDGKRLPIISKDKFNRRSGVAITDSGDLLLFATTVRFPGASFE